MSAGFESAAVFRLTLSAPASTAAAASASVRMPPPTASGNEELARDGADGVGQRPALLERRGDVEDDELVDAFEVVAPRQLRRIAGRSQPLEVDALDDLTVADVEAGDDAFRDSTGHRPGQLRTRSAAKLRRIRSPTSPDFSG